LKPPLAATLTV
jgi:hypothetical protein